MILLMPGTGTGIENVIIYLYFGDDRHVSEENRDSHPQFLLILNREA